MATAGSNNPTQAVPAPAATSPAKPASDEAPALPLDVPLRFLGAVRGDPVAAAKRWSETVAFREAGNHPLQVLERPQPHFHRIKARHRHFIHKRDKLGHIVAFEVVESPNKAFLDLANEGITVDDVANHMHFVSAFTYVKILDDVDTVGVRPKDPEGYFLKIIDLKKIGLGDCGGDTAKYFKQVAGINRHYPERVWKTLIINAPSIFGIIWTIVSPLLEPNVREKISVCRHNYQDTLRELVDPANLPVEYGGTDDKLSPEEVALAAFADQVTKAAAPAPADDALHTTADLTDHVFATLDQDNRDALEQTTTASSALPPKPQRPSESASAAQPTKPVRISSSFGEDDALEHI